MAYKPTQWRNDITPLNERNMNNIEQGIVDNEKESARISERLEEAIEYIQEVDEAKATPAQVDDKIKAHNEDADSHPSILTALSNRYTKSETDTAITNAISTLINEAPEELDTLKELVDYIKTHESDALEAFDAIREELAVHIGIDNQAHSDINETIDTHTANADTHVTRELQDKWNEHTDNTDIHVTTIDKTNWNKKAEAIHSHVWGEVYACEPEENGTDTVKDKFTAVNTEIDNLKKADTDTNTRIDNLNFDEQYYKKAEVDAAFATKTYTNTEIANAIAELVDSSPDVLNTLNELSAAINNDPNFHDTITTLIDTKADKTHTHDDRYYTETESDSLFAPISHTHDDRYYTETESNSLFASISHTHDDRYYTESEINNLLSQKLPLSGGTMTGLLNAYGGISFNSNDAISDIGTIPYYVGIKAFKDGGNMVYRSLNDTKNDLGINNKLSTSGGTLTGSIRFLYDTGSTIAIQISDNQSQYDAIKFRSQSGTTYGQGITIGAGGCTIIGGGESAQVCENQFLAENEQMFVCNDSDIWILSNLQNGWNSKKVFVFKSNGDFDAENGLVYEQSKRVFSPNNYPEAIKDKTNGTLSYLDYGRSGYNDLNNLTWFAAWDGYTVVPVHRNGIYGKHNLSFSVSGSTLTITNNS